MQGELLDTWLEEHGWAKPVKEHIVPLRVFEREGILACKWRYDSVTLQNKKEALKAKFYGSSATGRTSFMATGYSVLMHYAKWCDDTGVGLALDTAAKAKAFLESRIESARDLWKRRTERKHKGRANSAAESALNAYRQSVCHLSALSQWQGYGLDFVTTEELHTLRLNLVADIKRSKVRVHDSASTSALLTKRLDPGEWNAMLVGLWRGDVDKHYKTATGRARAAMRALLGCVLNQCAGRRGGDLRGLDLRMFLWHALPDVKPMPCYAIGASLRMVKEDNTWEDKEHLIGWMRARDRKSCPVGVLAGYLVWYNEHIRFIDTMRHDLVRPTAYRENGASEEANATLPKWWFIPLMGGISSSTHTKLTHAAFDSGDVHGKRAVTHIHRPTALGGMLEGGIVSTDAALYQGWVHGVWADTYAKAAFKTLPMLKAHGWDGHISSWECWWEGKEDDIPRALLERVFPGLDEVARLADARWAKFHDDRSAIEFARVLRILRRVFLEDSVVHWREYPEWPGYAEHVIWQVPELRALWTTYAREETARVCQREREWKWRQHDPALANQVLELTDMMKGLMAGGSASKVGVANIASTSAQQVQAMNSSQETQQSNQIAVHSLPELMEPHATDLKITYKRWSDAAAPGQLSVRDAYAAYLAEHKRITWAKIFDKSHANAAKVRYYRMLPFLKYVDEHGERVLLKLQKIMDEHKVDAPKFIKNCFYAMVTGSNIESPIKPDELREALAVY